MPGPYTARSGTRGLRLQRKLAKDQVVFLRELPHEAGVGRRAAPNVSGGCAGGRVDFGRYGNGSFVRNNDVNAALRVLKKKMQREGTFREMKLRRSYEKPSERRVREKAESVRRYRKMLRKRLEREGY